MIYPIQTILPLCFPEDTQDVVKEYIPDLGPLHLHLCKGIEFTSKHQLPIVKPNHIVPPEEITTLSRLKNVASNKKSDYLRTFTLRTRTSRKYGIDLSRTLKLSRVWLALFQQITQYLQIWLNPRDNGMILGTNSWLHSTRGMECRLLHHHLGVMTCIISKGIWRAGLVNRLLR